jgi:hypothetical protein
MRAAILDGQPIGQAADIYPAEAAAIAAYGEARFDSGEASGEHGRRVAAEIAGWRQRSSEPAAPPAAAAAETEAGMTQEQAQARADQLSRALNGKLSGYAKAQLAGELVELHEAFPNLRAFSTAGMSSAEIAAMKGDRISVVPHEMSDRARQLTEEMRFGKAAVGASRYYAMRDELMTELEMGAAAAPVAPMSRASSPMPMSASTAALTRERADIRSQRSRDLAANLAGKIGADRRATLDALTSSLAADQAAADTAGAGPGAGPAAAA